MQNSKLLLLSVSAFLILAGCNSNDSSSQSNSNEESSTASSISSSESSESKESISSSESSSESQTSESSSQENTDIKPTKLTTNFSRTVIGIGEELVIDVVFAPENTTLKNLKFISSNPAAISVDSLKRSIKGVAVSSKAVTITIKSTDNSECSPITLYLTCSKDSSVVDADKASAKLSTLAANEQDHISKASIELTQKTSQTANEMSYTCDFTSYDNHSYSVIKDFDGKEYTAYRGYDEDYLYEISYDSTGKATDSRKYSIEENSSFTTSYTTEEAKEHALKAVLKNASYSSKYTYGVSSYLDYHFFDSIYDTSTSTTTMNDSSITIIYNKKDISTSYKYKLVIEFEDDCYKKVSYSQKSYSTDDLDDDFNPVDGNVTPLTFYTLDASFTIVDKKSKDTTESGFEPNDLFYSTFSLDFYDSSDDTNTPATTFTRGTTITYKAKDFLPAKANGSIDIIYVSSVEDTNVLSISQNNMALNAVGEGTTRVTFKSKKATYTAQLTVTVAAATDIYTTTLPSSMLATDHKYITIEARPYGALNDFDIYLTEESKKYATLTKIYDEFYKLDGNPDMEEKEGVATIVIQSRSNASLRKELTIKVMRALTSKELLNVLTTHHYVSEASSDWYNIHTEVDFTTEYVEEKGYKGVYSAIEPTGKIYDTINFYYTIANGKLSVTDFTSQNNYLEKFTLSVYTPDGLTIYASVADTADTNYEDGDTQSMRLVAEETEDENK